MRLLESRYPFHDWSRTMSPFEVLVSTILSQSTTVANERRGLEGLRARFGAITPENLAGARVADIRKAIWHAGLAGQKAPRIHETARQVLGTWKGNLGLLLAHPTERARDGLMALPGVGPKTADVVLAMAADRPVLPVDTHIARIARRWDLVDRGGYEATRDALERWTPPEKRKAWHLALIAHGRALCTARDPRCEACPVRRDCDWHLRSGASRGRSRSAKQESAPDSRQRVKNR